MQPDGWESRITRWIEPAEGPMSFAKMREHYEKANQPTYRPAGRPARRSMSPPFGLYIV